jgi:hypothetical protein
MAAFSGLAPTALSSSPLDFLLHSNRLIRMAEFGVQPEIVRAVEDLDWWYDWTLPDAV